MLVLLHIAGHHGIELACQGADAVHVLVAHIGEHDELQCICIAFFKELEAQIHLGRFALNGLGQRNEQRQLLGGVVHLLTDDFQ